MTRAALLAPRLRLPRTGLAVLLDGRYPSGYSGGRFPLADGAALAQWNDVSGAGLHATQATAASQPQWFTDGTVGFDGTASRLGAPTTGLLRNVTGGTTYVLARSDAADTGTRNAFVIGTDAANQTGQVLRRANTGGAFIAGGRRTTTDSFVTTTSSTLLDGAGWRVLSLASNFSAGTFEMFVGGGSVGTGTYTSAGSTPDAERLGDVSIGSNAAGSGEFWAGRIAAVAIYHALHGPQERAWVVEAFRRGWGLTS